MGRLKNLKFSKNVTDSSVIHCWKAGVLRFLKTCYTIYFQFCKFWLIYEGGRGGGKKNRIDNYYQKPQNSSFPMVYYTWVNDNFEILNFFTPPLPPHKLAKMNKIENILYNMFSEISEHQLSNGVSHLSLWQFWKS